MILALKIINYICIIVRLPPSDERVVRYIIRFVFLFILSQYPCLLPISFRPHNLRAYISTSEHARTNSGT